MAKFKRQGKEPPPNSLGIEPRNLTIEQRRELFLKAKGERSGDWRVVQENQQTSLVPFNMLSLDYGLRLYGLAGNGTVYHIHGDEGAGKSTLTYAINREYQKTTKEPIGIFDFERTTKSWYLRAMGIDEGMAYVKQPDSIEDAMKDAIDLINQGVRLLTFDSIPRMRPMVAASAIKSGEAFKVQPGTHARAIQQFYDLILPHIARVDGTLLMVNQVRSRIEMTQEAQSAAQGYDTVTNLNYILPGGKANRFAASAMIELKTLKAWKPGAMQKSAKPEDFILEAESQRNEQYLANEVRVRTLKNKITGTGYRQTTLWIRPGLGTDETISIRQYGRQLGLIAFGGGKKWYVGESKDDAIKVYDDKASAIKDLVENPNPEVLFPLRDLIIKKLKEDASIGAIEVDEATQSYLSGEIDVDIETPMGHAKEIEFDDAPVV